MGRCDMSYKVPHVLVKVVFVEPHVWCNISKIGQSRVLGGELGNFEDPLTLASDPGKLWVTIGTLRCFHHGIDSIRRFLSLLLALVEMIMPRCKFKVEWMRWDEANCRVARRAVHRWGKVVGCIRWGKMRQVTWKNKVDMIEKHGAMWGTVVQRKGNFH